MGRLIQGVNDLETYCKEHPEVAHLLDEWDYERNEGLTPGDVSRSTNSVAWWVCKLGHSWDMKISERTRSNRQNKCPICMNKRLLPGYNDLATRYPDIAIEWDFVGNSPSTPDKVLSISGAKVDWICRACGCKWNTKISLRTCGHGCPDCAKQKYIATRKKNRLSNGYSLAEHNPELLKEWDVSKNKISPYEITYGSAECVWWRCSVCSYEYLQKINSRTSQNYGCPRCKYDRRTITYKNTILDKRGSFADKHPDLIKEWMASNSRPPYDCTESTNEKIWWKCSKCAYEWIALVSNRARGTGCPRCEYSAHVSFPEKSFAYYLKSHQIIENYRIKGTKMEADIYVPGLNLAIEYDGHAWHSDAKAVNRDIRKNVILAKRGIRLIRIREEGCPTLLGDFIEYKVNPDQSDLGDVVKRVLSEQFGIEADVDIERDRAEIMKLVKGE